MRTYKIFRRGDSRYLPGLADADERTDLGTDPAYREWTHVTDVDAHDAQAAIQAAIALLPEGESTLAAVPLRHFTTCTVKLELKRQLTILAEEPAAA